MRFGTIFAFLCIASTVFAEGDGPGFLISFPHNRLVCQGTKVMGSTPIRDLGRVKIELTKTDIKNPFIEVQSEDGAFHFKIGDGYAGTLNKISSCRYYSTNDAVFYLCHLMDSQKEINFRDVMDSNSRSSFSSDLVCANSRTCIKLTKCSKLE